MALYIFTLLHSVLCISRRLLYIAFIAIYVFLVAISKANASMVVDVPSGHENPVQLGVHFVVDHGQQAKIVKHLWKTILSDLQTTKLFVAGLNQRDVFNCDPNDANDRSCLIAAMRENLDNIVIARVQKAQNKEGEIDSVEYNINVEVWHVGSQKLAHKASYKLTDNKNDIRRIGHDIADCIMFGVFRRYAYFNSKILYVADLGDRTGSEGKNKRIAIIDRDGYKSGYIGEVGLLMSPSYLPSTQQIAYISYAGGNPRMKALNVSSGEVLDLGQELSLGNIGEKAIVSHRISPDGAYMLLSIVEGRNTNLYRYNMKTNALKRLLHGGINISPSFSPGGREFIFSSDARGSSALYVSDIESGRTKRVTFNKGIYNEPTWSPDGSWIAYTKIIKGQFHIGIMRPDGSDERILFSAYSAEKPAWSPSGREIVFSAQDYRYGKHSLRIINLNGVELSTLETKTDALDPYWFVVG